MASDGVWDNLFETNVRSCIKKEMTCKKKLKKDPVNFRKINSL